MTSGYAETRALTSVEVDADNPFYDSVDGVLYSKDHSRLILYPTAKNSGGTYTVMDGTTEIANRAFTESGLVLSLIHICSSPLCFGMRTGKLSKMPSDVCAGLPTKSIRCCVHSSHARACVRSSRLGVSFRMGGG